MSQPSARLHRHLRDDLLKYPVLKTGPEYGLRQLATGMHVNIAKVLPVLEVDPPAQPLYAGKIKKIWSASTVVGPGSQ
jgi:hypothetical protein